jgi:DNA/RNA endonuclease YhcR with UshA esterase domain
MRTTWTATWPALTACLLAIALAVGPEPARADSTTISPTAAINHVGESVTVCGVVASAKFAERTNRQPTFLNFGTPYPNQVFTAVIWGSNRGRFAYPPETLEGQTICVSGKVELYKGKAEIIVSTPAQIKVRK